MTMRVGIDLGASFSSVSRVREDGMPVLFQERSRADQAATPSVVHIGADGALVGEAVEELLEDVPNLPVARFAKLFMGQAAPIYTDHAGRYWYPEAIAAVILKKLVRDVERNSDESIDGAILCVPAQFDDAQRRAMLNAAILAGLSVLDLVAEPFAAAAFYGTRPLHLARRSWCTTSAGLHSSALSWRWACTVFVHWRPTGCRISAAGTSTKRSCA